LRSINIQPLRTFGPDPNSSTNPDTGQGNRISLKADNPKADNPKADNPLANPGKSEA
jgi:hypothetical protein